jgi:hypothetical protein
MDLDQSQSPTTLNAPRMLQVGSDKDKDSHLDSDKFTVKPSRLEKRDSNASFVSNAARVIEMSQYKASIDRRQKFITGLQKRRNQHLKTIVNFSNEKDGHYYLQAIEGMLNSKDLEKNYSFYKKQERQSLKKTEKQQIKWRQEQIDLL